MKEIYGNLWSWYGKPQTIVLITTNGEVTKTGRCVMGRGCAAEARTRFPNIDLELGRKIRDGGNLMHSLDDGKIWSFPVKHHWREPADLALIATSANQLGRMAAAWPDRIAILPRPGCGNGQRTWEEVQPVLAWLPDNVMVITK
jgi:hypothetical protein